MKNLILATLLTLFSSAAFVSSAAANADLIAPVWLLKPVEYKENHFSASACVRIDNNNEMLARSSALDIARKEVGLYLQGFDPSNPDLAQQLLPKIYMSESAVWLREDDSRDFCVLASMNYRDLSNVSNSGVESSDFKKIQERFSLLTQLSANGQDRERRADEAKIAEYEQRLKKNRDIVNNVRAIRFTQIEYLEQKDYKDLFQFTIENGSSWDIASVDFVLKFFKGNRTIPIYSAEIINLRPLGGIVSGETITTKEIVYFSQNDKRVKEILESRDEDLRWEARATDAYDASDSTLGQDMSEEEIQNSRVMRELRTLKAKWQIQ